MAATKSEIQSWFMRGKASGGTHLIVVCDTFDHEDYPAFVYPGQDWQKTVDGYNAQSMQRVMEVYDLREPLEPQLEARRAWPKV